MGKPRWRYGFVLYFRYTILTSLNLSCQVRWWCHCCGSTVRSTLTSADSQGTAGTRCSPASTGTLPRWPALRTNASSWHSTNTAGEKRQMFRLYHYTTTQYTNTPFIFPFSVRELMWHKLNTEQRRWRKLLFKICVSGIWGSHGWLTTEWLRPGTLSQRRRRDTHGPSSYPPVRWRAIGSSSVGKSMIHAGAECTRIPTELSRTRSKYHAFQWQCTVKVLWKV